MILNLILHRDHTDWYYRIQLSHFSVTINHDERIEVTICQKAPHKLMLLLEIVKYNFNSNGKLVLELASDLSEHEKYVLDLISC